MFTNERVPFRRRRAPARSQIQSLAKRILLEHYYM